MQNLLKDHTRYCIQDDRSNDEQNNGYIHKRQK